MSVCLITQGVSDCASNLLLGNSQTFIGVLATIVVLYLYTKESNFFISFIEHLKEEGVESVNKRITYLTEQVEAKFWLNNEEEDNHNKFISKSIESLQQTIPEEQRKVVKDLQQQLYNTVLDAQKIPISFMNKFSPLQEDVTKRMNKLAAADEFEYVAFYTFFFSILILFIDSTFSTLGKIACCSLFSFAMSSCVFMFFLWGHLWRKTSKGYNEENTYRMHQRGRCEWMLFTLKIILLFVFVPSVIIIIGVYIESYSSNLVLVVGGYLLCFAIGGGFHFSKIKNSHKYNRGFILSHFIYLIIASIIVGFICVETPLKNGIALVLNNAVVEYPEEHFANLIEFKWVLVCFITLNSIVMPFALSYTRCSVILWSARYQLQKEEKLANEKIAEYKKTHDEIVKKIVVSVVG